MLFDYPVCVWQSGSLHFFDKLRPIIAQKKKKKKNCQ